MKQFGLVHGTMAVLESYKSNEALEAAVDSVSAPIPNKDESIENYYGRCTQAFKTLAQDYEQKYYRPLSTSY